MSSESSTASSGGPFAQLRAIRAEIVQARILQLHALAAVAAGHSREKAVSEAARVLSLTENQAAAVLDLALSMSRGEIEGEAAAEAYDRLVELFDDLDNWNEGGD